MNARAVVSEREQIELLQEEILWLRGELGLLMREEEIFEVRERFGGTKSEARLLLTLINGKLMTKDLALHAMAEPGSDDFPLEKVVDVLICKIRRRLRPMGIDIETQWGCGYYLTAESRRRIAKLRGQMP